MIDRDHQSVTGYRVEARRVAERFIQLCEESDAEFIVSPSGSCTAMVHHYEVLFSEDEEWRARARAVTARMFELSSFLIRVLKVADVGARFKGRVTWHDACHGLRELGVHDEPRTLIKNVRETEFVELDNADACCGFGGTFSVKYPEISVAILDEKVDAIDRAGVDAVVSGDASCLMQIGGRLRGALRHATTLFGERRRAAIAEVPDWEGARDRARAIKDETLLHLDRY